MGMYGLDASDETERMSMHGSGRLAESSGELKWPSRMYERSSNLWVFELGGTRTVGVYDAQHIALVRTPTNA